MDKPRYRYNWKTGGFDEVFRVELNQYEFGPINPKTGMYNIMSIPRYNPSPAIAKR